jgi:hypothetical protein
MSMTKRAAAMIVADLMASFMTPTLHKSRRLQSFAGRAQEPNGRQNPEAGCPRSMARWITGQFGVDLVFAREDAVQITDGNRR